MKQFLTTLSLASALFLGFFSYASSATYDISAEGGCETWQTTQMGLTPCWSISQTATVNDTAPVNSSVSVSVSRGVQWLQDQPTRIILNCVGSGCDYAAWTTATLGTTETIASSGESSNSNSIGTGASTGAQTITMNTSTDGLSCNIPTGWNCIIEGPSQAYIPITITAPASVDLQIGSIIDKLIDLFI
jgi:hypothetical protein